MTELKDPNLEFAINKYFAMQIAKEESKGEAFSLKKFFSGFANVGKIAWIFALFLIFNVVMSKLAPRIGKVVEDQKIETYIEAPENKPVRFFGVKINRFGFGCIWE